MALTCPHLEANYGVISPGRISPISTTANEAATAWRPAAWVAAVVVVSDLVARAEAASKAAAAVVGAARHNFRLELV